MILSMSFHNYETVWNQGISQKVSVDVVSETTLKKL
jgi:hypothetical protein